MKKIFILIIACFSFLALFPDKASALEVPTQSPTEKNEAINKQIKDFQTRVASTVAQLKLVERKGILGTVSEVSTTQITLTDTNDNTRFVDVDELTKFSSPLAKGTFGISDLSKGTTIGVLGLYNKESRRILGRFIETYSLSKTVHGIVTSADGSNFILNVASENGETVYADIEKITKTLSYSKNTGLTRIGFSKIKEGQRVIVIGYPDIKDKNRISALRVLVFPDIPKNPRIAIPENINLSDTIVPSTGSGKKLTPITK